MMWRCFWHTGFFLWVAAVCLAAMVGLPLPAVAAVDMTNPKHSRIVVITSQPYATEWFNSFNDSLVDAIGKYQPVEPQISYEYIEGKIAFDPQMAAIVIAFLKQKYEWDKVDLVIGVMPAGSVFLLEHGEKFAKNVPKLYVLPSQPQAEKIAVQQRVGMVRSTGDALTESVKGIRRLLPAVKRLYVVAGSGADDREYLIRTQKLLAAEPLFETVTYLSGLEPSELVHELSMAPSDSAVMLLTYVMNRYEQPVSTTQVLKMISPQLHIPIFSFYDTVMGKGIVGGYLTSAQAYGETAAAAAGRLLLGETKPVVVMTSPRFSYDWRQLQRWNISEQNLPPESQVKFRSYTVWELYRWYIVGALAVLVIQGILIILLLWNRRQRHKLALELRLNNAQLEAKVEERTQALSRSNQELIAANEELTAMNETLDNLNQLLERELGERQRMETVLAEANRKLKELDLMKSMFIACMSHELRTPLNSIIGFTGMTLQELSGPLNEEQKDNLSRVKRAANHLLSLITDIIDVSKIESGKITSVAEPFMINQLIQEAIVTVQPQARDKGLLIEFVPPAEVKMLADRRRLLQCVINYLSNAVKYSETGKVTVAVRQLGTDIEISVTDTGIGIASEDLQRLFEPFERVQSHLQVKAGGTGLGLYLTKKLATEVLHGEVSAESVKGEGSTFLIRVPVEYTKEEALPDENRTGH